MTDLVFVDTNVVIYTRDQSEPEKARKAQDWLRTLRERDLLVVSPQVLNELFAVSAWKFKEIDRGTITAWVRIFMPHCTAPLDADVVAVARDLSGQYGLQWWDCVIVASALRGNCRFILSEDMQHRQIVRTIQIIDPFRSEPGEIFA